MKKSWKGRMWGWLAWLLLLATVLSGIACKTDGNSTDTDRATEEQTESEEPDNDTRMKLVNAGEAAVTVVYPENITRAMKQIVTNLIDAIEKETGVRLKSKSDSLRVGATHNPDTPELLIGETNYDETGAVLEQMAAKQFAICRQGAKAVIAARSDSDVQAALQYYITNLISQNVVEKNGKKTLYFGEYTPDSGKDDNPIRINGESITGFFIIYEKGNSGYQVIAEQLQSLIQDETGVRLPVCPDATTEETAGEFLVGPTNRALSKTLYETEKPKLLTYELVVKGNKVQILCGGTYSARECVNSMEFSFMNGEKKEYTDGKYFSSDLAPIAQARADGTDLRIMTSNVLASRWGEDYHGNPTLAATIPPADQRAEIYAAVLANYQPDVVGIQETDYKWGVYLPQYLETLKTVYGIEYTWVYPDINGVPNLTGILYRSDKLNLIKSDFFDYSFWDPNYPYHLRSIAWGLFREKSASAREFVLASTHWSGPENPEMAAACISEETELVNKLKKEYNVPVFCTGDFNHKQDSEGVAKFLEATGMRESMRVAKENGTLVNYIGGCANVGQPRQSETYIDHIFGYGNFSVLRYETILGNRVVWLSDHSPQIADIKFN